MYHKPVLRDTWDLRVQCFHQIKSVHHRLSAVPLSIGIPAVPSPTPFEISPLLELEYYLQFLS